MAEEKTLLNATLVFPVLDRGSRVMMAMKVDEIGAGCWNGYGGGIEDGEDPRMATVRELQEESGLITTSDGLEKVALLDFCNTKSDGESFNCRVHVFLAHAWRGILQETTEMSRPRWFYRTRLPLDKMMLADQHWVPLILGGKKVLVTAHYGPFQKELLGSVVIQEVDVLD